jgi:hypothetical protein
MKSMPAVVMPLVTRMLIGWKRKDSLKPACKGFTKANTVEIPRVAWMKSTGTWKF